MRKLRKIKVLIGVMCISFCTISTTVIAVNGGNIRNIISLESTMPENSVELVLDDEGETKGVEEYSANNQTENVYSGTCGEDVVWTLDQEGVLIISGSGEMTDYKSSVTAPWYEYFENIKEVIVQDGVKSVGAYAFSNCSNITDITISQTVQKLGKYAFNCCKSLKNISLPKEVTYFDSTYMFRVCSSLETVILPEGVSELGGTFVGCTNLKNVQMPDTVEYISIGAFTSCKSLETLTLSKGLKELGEYIFENCSALKSIYFTGDAPKIMYKSGGEGYTAFEGITTTCYYPDNNDTWNDFGKKGYGGTVTWTSYTPQEDNSDFIDIVVNNVGADVSNAVVTEPEDGWKVGENTFSVSCDVPCSIFITNDNGQSFIRLETMEIEDKHYYTVSDLTQETQLYIMLTGDANGDGKLTTSDVTKLKAAALQKSNLDAATSITADVNGDGKITTADVTKLKAVVLKKTNLKW